MGVKKTAIFCVIIVILSTIVGITYGWIAGYRKRPCPETM
jgi:ABC-type dipeptide/oligopeptide/nickel transport system permease subunit